MKRLIQRENLDEIILQGSLIWYGFLENKNYLDVYAYIYIYIYIHTHTEHKMCLCVCTHTLIGHSTLSHNEIRNFFLRVTQEITKINRSEWRDKKTIKKTWSDTEERKLKYRKNYSELKKKMRERKNPY